MDRNPIDLCADALSPVGLICEPAFPAQAPTHSPTRPPQTETGNLSVRVVLAHRHGIFSQGLAALLAAHPGIRIEAQVTDGEAAWEAIRARAPEVALLDLDLDRVPGIQVAARVRVAALPTRCLMLAHTDDPAPTSRALGAGAAGCLLKDSGFEELVFALQRVRAGGTFVSPALAAKLCAPRPEGPSLLDLTARERQVLRLVAAGNTSKEVARILGIGRQTVETHRRRLMKKLDLHCAAQVVRFAVDAGVLA